VSLYMLNCAVQLPCISWKWAVAVVKSKLLLTLKGLLQQLLGCCWAVFFQVLLISAWNRS